MKIKKFGQCCLLIETKGKRILTDPGSYTVEEHSKLENLDYILFTHEHQDHYHLESLKVLVEKNPQALIYSNTSVSELLDIENIKHTLVKHGDNISLGEISLVGIGEKHAEIYSSMPMTSNTGFFIDEKLWYPGDAFTKPERPVDILALPVAGPWMKISEAIDYALALKPKVAFPVHDYKNSTGQRIAERFITPSGIKFVFMTEGEEKEF